MARQLVRVEGLRELERALAELPKSTGKAVLRRVLRKAAEPIFQSAKEAAPERPADAPDRFFKSGGEKKRRLPGTLDALVQSGTRLTRNQARLAKKQGKSSVEHYVGTRDPVGRLIEFGTVDTAAQPFLRPAWDNGKAQALSIIESDLGQEIEKAAARLARKAARAASKG